MKQRGFFRTIIVLIMTASLLLVGTSIAFAAASPKSITYNGSGRVTVNFKSKVTYDDVAITIKDNSGKKYSTSIKKKSATSIQFLIEGYKTGKTYKVSVSGIGGGTVAGSFKIYSKSKAISIAKSTAKKDWAAKKYQNVKAKSSIYRKKSIWKVTFQSGDHSYTYMVAQQTGKVIYSERK